MKLLVKYTFRSAEDETTCEVLMQGPDDNAKDIIHSKFKQFWSKTDTEERGRIYINSQGYPMVKIERWDEVPDDDWIVLKEYLTEI